MKAYKFPRVVTGLAVAAVMLAGCTAAPVPGALTDDSTAMDLLTRSGSYQTRQHTVDNAEEVLVGRCMTAKGWAYPAQPPPRPASYEERLLGLDQRRRVGYGLTGGEERAPSPVDLYVAQLAPAASADFTRAMLGDDSKRKAVELPDGSQATFAADGCVSESRTKLYPDLLTWARVTHLPETFLNRITGSLTAAPAYIDAMDAWQRCMQRHGHHHRLPEDAREHLRARYQAEGTTDQLRKHEVEVAVTDAECAAEVRLPQVVLATTRSKAVELTADEQQALREVAAVWSSAVTKAERLLD